MANVKTITLGGAEQKVIISGQNCDIRNDGAETVYASAKPNITAGEDGVLAIPVGQAAKLLDSRGKVYLKGTGIVQLCGNDYGYLVFKSAPAGGGSGGTQDDVARNMASANAASISALRGDVEDVQTVAENVSNPNLLINPDFKINQRGETEYVTAGYTVDMWNSNSGRISKTVNANGGIRSVCNTGTWGWLLYQSTEGFRYPQGVYTASINASGVLGKHWGFIASAYNAEGKALTEAGEYITETGITSFTIDIPADVAKINIGVYAAEATQISAGDYIDLNWVKFEPGTVATPFTPPDPATELAKCQRYFQIRTTGDIAPIDLRPSMRIAPTVTELADGNYAYSAEL